MVSIFESLVKVEKLEIGGVRDEKMRKFIRKWGKWIILALIVLLAGIQQLLHV